MEYNDYPWGEDGNSPTNDICVCCGGEFGYEDGVLEGIRDYREDWIKKGYPWFTPKFKPENWDLKKQMENIPEEFR